MQSHLKPVASATMARFDGFEDSDGFGFGTDDSDASKSKEQNGMVYGDNSEKMRMMKMLDPQQPTPRRSARNSGS